MGSEASTEKSQKAARGSGENEAVGAGPEEFPRNEEFEGSWGGTGHIFGDKKQRRQPSEGADLQMGFSHRIDFYDEEIIPGEGRDESTGKPDEPDMSNADNGGASATLKFG